MNSTADYMAINPMTVPKRRWFQWSLRTLFVVMALFGCWLGYEVNWIRERHTWLPTP